MTAIAAHRSTEGVLSGVTGPMIDLEAAIADADLGGLIPASYEAPAAELDHVEYENEPYLWYVLFAVLYATALAYAAYCTYKGGSPVISLTWRGFKMACYR